MTPGDNLLSQRTIIRRWPFPPEPPDYYDRLSLCSNLSITVRQAYAIALYERFLTVLSALHASVTIWEATHESNYPPYNVLMWITAELMSRKTKRYFTGTLRGLASMSPSYSKYVFPSTM